MSLFLNPVFAFVIFNANMFYYYKYCYSKLNENNNKMVNQ
jgi:hypothetical protein